MNIMLYLLFYSATEERMDDRMREAEEKEDEALFNPIVEKPK